jgi:hypothetical protein
MKDDPIFTSAFRIVGKVKRMDLTVRSNIGLDGRFERKIIVAAHAKDQAIIVFLVLVLLGDPVGVTYPFAAVTQPTDTALVSTTKFWFVIVLEPGGGTIPAATGGARIGLQDHHPLLHQAPITTGNVRKEPHRFIVRLLIVDGRLQRRCSGDCWRWCEQQQSLLGSRGQKYQNRQAGNDGKSWTNETISSSGSRHGCFVV